MPTAKKKPASDKRAAPTRKAAPARAPEKKQAVKPIRREVGAVVCLLLALFAALGYFASDAWFIHIFGTALKGLLGYGFWIVPPLLLLAAYILGFHRGRPVRLRLVSALLLPLLLGALLHLFLAKGDYPWSLGMVADLWKSGVLLESGGVCSGLLALGFAQVFSKVGTSIVFIILGILMLLFSFNRTLVDVVDSFRNRPRAHYEPKAPPVPPPAPVPHAVERPAKTGKPIIDIPVEDGPLVGVAPETAAKPKKSRFFNRDRSVPTPEEVLTGAASHPPVPEPPADDEDFTAAVPPVVTAFPSAGVTRPA
ncbi:MAG: DNA translocase FtsK, partial [Oscillospiraceae bacterium]